MHKGARERMEFYEERRRSEEAIDVYNYKYRCMLIVSCKQHLQNMRCRYT